MKALVVVALWAMLGWYLGAFGEALLGIPSTVGLLLGVAIGAGLAFEVRRRVAAGSERVQRAAATASPSEALGALDRAA